MSSTSTSTERIPADAPFDESGVTADNEHLIGHDRFSTYADFLCTHADQVTPVSAEDLQVIRNAGAHTTAHLVAYSVA